VAIVQGKQVIPGNYSFLAREKRRNARQAIVSKMATQMTNTIISTEDATHIQENLLIKRIIVPAISQFQKITHSWPKKTAATLAGQ